MNLQLKQEYLDAKMSCPFTGKMIDLAFLDNEMYQHYYNVGHQYLFEDIEQPKEKNKKK